MNSAIKRPELTLEPVEKSTIFCDLVMCDTGVYEGRKTFIKLPVVELAELGFDLDVDEYSFSIQDAALNALLREAGVRTEADKCDGVSVDIGTPRSQEELYRSYMLQLNSSLELSKRVNAVVNSVVDDCWPYTYRVYPVSDKPSVMSNHATRNLTGEWRTKEELTKNAVSALFEVFEPEFAKTLAQQTREMEEV